MFRFTLLVFVFICGFLASDPYHSWQRIHRTRRGWATPVTACPSGANMLLSVMSGTLEVLVYSTEELHNLRPVYGRAPCAERTRGLSSIQTAANDSDAPSIDTGLKADEQVRQSLSDDEKMDPFDGAVPTNTLNPATTSEEDAWDGWPHEPHFCARVWPADGDGPTDDSTEDPSPT